MRLRSYNRKQHYLSAITNPEISTEKKNAQQLSPPATTKIPKRNNTKKYRSPPLHSGLAMQNFQLPKTSTQNHSPLFHDLLKHTISLGFSEKPKCKEITFFLTF
jgi:hypothetical protein